uniref:AlNc14C66G4675 protein n=1 Tax=Albugo laibachii Nc14 TaxID=890382 RepID=F0WDF5_9STRA|nr:AlNc14C66G4675 [Albugo laibachii Nc14]|eukprot:CCA19227.1 AlNc14C66G4675 [Albugo laibachii Nc14]
MSVRFLEYHFGEWRKRQVSPILLRDDFSAHWSERVRVCAEELGVMLMQVHPGYTSISQPAGVSWNLPIKQRLRVRWAGMLHQQLDSQSNGGDSFQLVPPTRDDVVEWLGKAWQELSIATISNGFSPILKEEELSESMQTSYNNLASRLQEINLLDGDVGIVSVSSDVVDSILESNR